MKPLLLIASGGLLAAVAAVVGYRRAEETKNTVLAATGGDAAKATQASAAASAATTSAQVRAAAAQIQAAAHAAPPSSPEVIAEADRAVADAVTGDVRTVADQVKAVAEKMTGNGRIQLRLTVYHPLDAKSAKAKLMEGPPNDRKGKELHYLEDALAGKFEWVSVSGDVGAWPYGQLLYIDAFPGIKFRVVDTGENFMSTTKVYRAAGREPIDVAVRSSSTKVPTNAVGTIVRGDHLDKAGKEIAVAKFRGQNVVVGALAMLGSK